ncbi:MAG: oligoendopeptidase F [Clostridiaceae bacterium]
MKDRKDISSKYKWKVEKIYENNKLWEKDYEKLDKESLKIKEYKGKLNSAENIIKFLNLRENILRLNEKLYVYANLKSDEDTRNGEYQLVLQKISGKTAEISGYLSYFVPEILELSEEEYSNILKDKRLNDYEFFLQDIRKMKSHILSKEKEEMLASMSDLLEAPSNIFGMLSHADLKFPKIKDENGEEVEISESSYSKYIKSKDRRVREEAFNAIFGTYRNFKNTYATTLTSSVKNFVFNAKSRNYKSSLAASLEPNNIPLEVYENAVKTINENLDSLHRYVKIKKRLLNLEEIHMYDLYTPVVDLPKIHISFEEGVNIAEKALNPLGVEYNKIFNKGINNGWIDVYENKGKRSGAYSSGCYDTSPYVLLNYNEDINSISTLAHEMGHSIHTYYSVLTQPYIYSDYTLFCAEVASTTNENLLIKYLIENEKDDKRRLYLINQELESIRTTVFRQIMFAEFELFTHKSIENNIPLNSESLSEFYFNLNKKYFGEDIIMDEEIAMEWARIPHFYRDFYVYQYATGYSAAYSFSKMILNKEEGALEKYFKFLKSGSSDYPINILKAAGVDMTKEKPIKDTIDRFNELMDMLEK